MTPPHRMRVAFTAARSYSLGRGGSASPARSFSDVSMVRLPVSLHLSRRAGLIAAAGALFALGGCNDSSSPKPPAPKAGGDLTEPTVDVAELMKPGQLPDQMLGKADAPVTIIEYASMTCGHCATFHNETFGHLKEKYIEPGKVKYIFREFPLDPVAYAASLLTRCAGEGKFFPMLELLFKQQRVWAFTDKPEEALLATVRQAGFTQDSFNTCLQDQATYGALQADRQRASSVFKIDSTPTFFFNGRIERGAMAPAQLDKLLASFLESAK
jgi:protein-disulfide isomerase